jgi:hypothetical protein
VIEARDPTMEPFISSWRDAYDRSLEEQECYLGSGEVSMDTLLQAK